MLDFSISKEQKMIKNEIAKLVKDLVVDNAHEMDETGEIQPETLQSIWEMGVSTAGVPEEFGGMGPGGSPVDTALILEELACGDMAVAVAATLPSLFIQPLLQFGTPEQQKKYLPMYCGEKYKPCTLAVNEPHFRFDAVDLKTTATRNNGGYVLNGEKCFVPLARKAEHIMVAASLEGKSQLFIVESGNPGMHIGEREKNLGLYSLESSEVKLTDCQVADDDRLGEENGCDYDRILQRTRIGLCAMATGVCRASFEFVRKYAKERVQFGEPIAHRQSVAFMIAEMAYEVDAIRLLTWKAASRLAAGLDAGRESYLAKLYAGEKAMKICDYGVQVLGGHGYVRDYPVERYYRNSRGISILEAMAIV
ncbi:MAG: acyl-CoA dehydrogenase family protein [Desulfobacterales bacterium]|nr:acyl-CoA dehydrogenase family protein [Desulfobacterales bacterium]